MSQGADDYIPKQMARDAQHAKDYRTWVASLSPSVRAKLRSQGIDEPEVSYHGTGMSDRDLAESSIASEEPDIIGQIDDAAVEPGQPIAITDHEALWDSLRRMLGELLNQKNAKLTLECFAVASGASFMGDSMTDIARRHGVTRAAVSKRCIDIARQLNLPPSRSMRAEKARGSYQKAQLQNHSLQNL